MRDVGRRSGRLSGLTEIGLALRWPKATSPGMTVDRAGLARGKLLLGPDGCREQTFVAAHRTDELHADRHVVRPGERWEVDGWRAQERPGSVEDGVTGRSEPQRRLADHAGREEDINLLQDAGELRDGCIALSQRGVVLIRRSGQALIQERYQFRAERVSILPELVRERVGCLVGHDEGVGLDESAERVGEWDIRQPCTCLIEYPCGIFDRCAGLRSGSLPVMRLVHPDPRGWLGRLRTAHRCALAPRGRQQRGIRYGPPDRSYRVQGSGKRPHPRAGDATEGRL